MRRGPEGEIATAIIGMDRRGAIMIRLRRRCAFEPLDRGTGGERNHSLQRV